MPFTSFVAISNEKRSIFCFTLVLLVEKSQKAIVFRASSKLAWFTFLSPLKSISFVILFWI